MATEDQNSPFYEFSHEYSSKAEELCDKLKLRTDESYNPYEWMFSSLERHFSGPEYETFFICQSKIESERKMEWENSQGEVGAKSKTSEMEDPKTASPELPINLGHIEAALHGCNVESGISADAINIISETPLMQVNEVCKLLRLEDLNETSLTVVCQTLIQQEKVLSYAASCSVIECLFRNKILNLQQTASRVFSTTLLSTTKQFPRQMLEAVILPVVQDCTFDVPQCDVICRIIKECLKPEEISVLFSHLLEINFAWTDVFIPLMQTLIDLKIPLDDRVLASLLRRFKAESLNLKNSLKFSKLLQSTVNKYGTRFTEDNIQCVRDALKENQTFLRKSIESSLRKLE